MNLYEAHLQWQNRPADERFETLADMHTVVEARDKASFDGNVDLRRIEFAVDDSRLKLLDSGGQAPVSLTQYAATAFARRLDVPLDLLARVDSNVATSVVNNRLRRYLNDESGDPTGRALVANANGEGTVIRALHGTGYARFSERVWDSDLTGLLVRNLPDGWRNPVAFAGGEWGAPLAPSGLYASDRDIFAFLIDGGDVLDVGRDDQFNAGFIVINSEVGTRAFRLQRFFFRRVCGNNIIWDASGFEEARVAHVGNARRKANDIMRRFLDSCVAGGGRDAFASVVELTREQFLAPVTRGKEEEAITAMRKRGFTNAATLDALQHIRSESKAPTGSAWDWVNGFTAAARSETNADARVAMETKAAALLAKVSR